MKKTNKLLLGLVGLSALVTLAACGSSKASAVKSIEDKKTLVVAVSPDYPPFEYQKIVDGKNQVVGADIDLAHKIADKMGVQLKISTMDFDNVLANLSQGKADLAISGISKSPDREKSFDFSDTYYRPVDKIVIKKSDLNKYKSVSDFKNKKIAAQKGSTEEEAVKKQITGSELVSLPAVGDEINELKAGKISGVVIEDMIAESYVSENSDLVIADIDLPILENNKGMAVAVKKGATDLQDKVNEVIKELKDSGEMDKIIQDNYKESNEK